MTTRPTTTDHPTPDEDDPAGEGPSWRPASGCAHADPDVLLDWLFTADPLLEELREDLHEEANTLRLVRATERETLSDLARDTRTWNAMGRGLRVLPLSQTNRQRVLKQCNHLYYRDPLARCIIKTYTYLTCGKGMRVLFPADVDPDGAAQARWDIIAQANDWERRYRDIITLTYLLGEWFVVRKPLVEDRYWDEAAGRPDADALRAYLAALPPEAITINSLSPLEVEEVVAAPTNRERPWAYKLASDTRTDVDASLRNSPRAPGQPWPDVFYANDVTHFKVDDLSLTDRGRPILEPVLRQIAYYRMFQLDRLTMTAIRTRIPLIRKIGGSGPKRKAGRKAAMEAHKLPRPGTVAIVGRDEEWIYPGGPPDGASAAEDGRTILLQIATGVNLPEFMVTADASNANLASTLAQSSPILAMFNDYRGRFAACFADMIEEIVGVRPQIEFPEIVRDELLKVVQAFSIMFRDGVVSRGTYRARVGLDPDEDERLADERDEAQPHDFGPAEEEPAAPPEEEE